MKRLCFNTLIDFCKIIFLLLFLLITNPVTSQNNKEINKQLFYFNQKLDSISQSLYLKDEIIKLQQAEIDKLTGLYNNVFNEYQVLEKGAQEQSKHIENQEWFLGVFMAVLIVAFFSIIALIVNIIERKKLNKDLETLADGKIQKKQ